jgi:nicotinamide mononucleotide adenylyltransferase
MYSQPVPDNSYIPKLKRTLSGTVFKSNIIGINEGDRDNKIEQLKQFLEQNINENETIDEITTQDNNGREFHFFYFIGRLNPPHQGHLETLNELVSLSNRQDSIPLILLGSGPGGIRTMDNPITFETKKYFIESKLDEKLDGRYEIQLMTNPAKNVSEYIQDRLGDNVSNIVRVTINHVAGGKDEDATKLNFVKTYAEKMVKSIANEADVESRVISMPANRSATKVRKDAYQTVLNGSGYEGWSQEYKDFYGDFAQTIYEEILFPLNLSDELSFEKREEIINYIERGELPNSKKKTTTRKKRTQDEEDEETPKQKTTRKSTRKKRTGGKRKTRGKRRKNKNKNKNKKTKNKK